MMRREDFHLTIDLEEGKNLLVTAQSSVGTAEVQPGQKLADLAPDRKIRQRAAGAADIKAYGARLYAALLPDEVRDLFDRSLEWYADTGWMRIRISALHPEVAAIPWELAYDGERKTFLALDPRTPVFRDWKRPVKGLPLTPAGQLDVLVSQPNPRSMAPIDAETESEVLQSALEIPRIRGQVRFTFLDPPVTLDKFRAALEEGDYQVVHFGGHGMLDPSRGTSALVFEDEAREASLVDAGFLANLFAGKPPRLITLLADNSASFREESSGELVSESIASALIQAGVPAVVGLQGLMRESQVGKFVRAFYASISDGQPLERALSEGRRAVYYSRPDAFDWASLTLYLAQDLVDTAIFAPAHSEAVAQKGQSVYASGGAVIKGDRQSINLSQKIQPVDRVNFGLDQPVTSSGSQTGPGLLEEVLRAEEAADAEAAPAGPQAPLAGGFDFSVPGLGVEAAEPPAPAASAPPPESVPPPASPLGLETISPLIRELKQTFVSMPGLSPRERIQRIALVEELRFTLLSQPVDVERVLKLIQQISVSGPKPAQLLSALRRDLRLDLRQRFETALPEER